MYRCRSARSSLVHASTTRDRLRGGGCSDKAWLSDAPLGGLRCRCGRGGLARSFVRSTDLRRRRRSLAPGPAWAAPLVGESVELTPAPDTTHPSYTRHTRPHTPTTAAPSPCHLLALLPFHPARPPPTLAHTPAHPRTAPACALVIHTYHTLWARSDTSGYVLITPHPRLPTTHGLD